MVVIMGAAGDRVRRHLAVHVEVREARPGGTKNDKKQTGLHHSYSRDTEGFWENSWKTDEGADGFILALHLTSCVVIKLRGSEQTLQLIAKARVWFTFIERFCGLVPLLLSRNVTFPRQFWELSPHLQSTCAAAHAASCIC